VNGVSEEAGERGGGDVGPRGWAKVGRVLAAAPRALDRVSYPTMFLVAFVALYVVVFGALTVRQHRNFASFTFDTGIFDQGIWLLSRFEHPFLTTRGLHYFGNHVNVTTVLLVPFYWLGAGPAFLYTVQTMVMAVGAVPLYLLARDRTKDGWVALGLAASYLLYPALQWNNWWQFHPDKLAIPAVLFAYLFAVRGRWGLYWAAFAFALLTKEDIAMALFALGFVLLVRGEHRRGLITGGLAVGWFLFCTQLVIPWVTDGRGPFYTDLYGHLGEGAFGVALAVLTRPGLVWELVTHPDRLTYYRDLFAPVAFLAVGSPLTLLISLPHLLVNSISNHAPTYDMRFQYSSMVGVGIFLATAESVARYGVSRWDRRYLIGLVVLAALLTNMAWSPSPLASGYPGAMWTEENPRREALQGAVEQVPPRAAVSASYNLVPHLTHRKEIYEFPNPWEQSYWGVEGEGAPDPATVEYVAVDLDVLGDESMRLVEWLKRGGVYEVIYEEARVVVLRRSAAFPPSTGVR
jgi:uncharacterized membrane protein